MGRGPGGGRGGGANSPASIRNLPASNPNRKTTCYDGPVTEKMTTATIGPTMLAACSSMNFRVLNSDRSPVFCKGIGQNDDQ